jgi:hypothetical protein
MLVLGVASAAPASAALTVPTFPTFGTYPEWLPGNYQVSNIDISEGSDTTLEVMESISNLYSEAGLYPFSCALVATGSATNQDCVAPSYAVNTTGATAGSFSITIAGYTTDSGIAWNATAASIQATLSNGTNGPAGTTVTGSPSTGPGVYTILPTTVSLTPTLVTANFSGLTGGADTVTQASNPNNVQTDSVDNFAGSTEVQGVNDTGSSNGQGELCGSLNAPVATTVAYARSSSPFSGTCNGLGFGFAKDSVTAVDFESIDPASYGTPSGYNKIGSFNSYDYSSADEISTPFPSGGIGDVADGWLPGDSPSCGYNGAAACSGTPFDDVDNTATPGSGLSATSSVAYRLWCQNDATDVNSPGAGLTQIMDWGDLTNLGPNLEVVGLSVNGTTTATLQTGENFPSTVAVGDAVTGPDIASGTQVAGVSGGTLTLSPAASGTGTVTVRITTSSALQPGEGLPIGVPIRIIGDNGSSGTAKTWFNFAKSGAGSGNCTTAPTNGVGGNYNPNAASGPNPQTNQGTTGNLEIALENDANQIGDYANADWGGSDPADEATDIATSLYFMGNGAYLSNPNASVANLELNSGTTVTGPTAFEETQLTANGVTAGTVTERNNSYPAARTLSNIVNVNADTASTGGFLDWLCDGGAPLTINGTLINPLTSKGTDHVDGGNYDTDLTNVINGEYDFSRLTDTSQELPNASQKTENGVVNPNGTCEATQAIGSGGISTSSTAVTLGSLTADPTNVGTSTIQAGWPVYIPSGYGITLPSGDTVASVTAPTSTSTGTITLTEAPVSGTGSGNPPTLYFPGHPPVLAVSNLDG